jgi:hypothetical protein
MDEEITITLADGADAAAVAERLRAAGVRVDQVLEAIGVITGTVAADRRQALAQAPGVRSVEPGRTLRIAPPDAPIP